METADLVAIPGRGACTDAERRAAVALAAEAGAGLATHWVRPQWALPVALAALLGAAGSLVSIAVPVAGLAASAVAAVSLALEAAGGTSPLRLLTRRRATQNVVALPEDDGERVALLVCAAYDAPRRGLVLNDRWRAIGRRLGNVRGWLAGCALLVAGACAARVGGIDAVWLGAVQLVPTAALIAAVAAALDIALSDVSPGAANASATAVALRAYEELSREAPAVLAPGLVLYGAGSSGPHALRRQLRGLDARRTVVLELGPCAAGTPAWRARHPQLRAAAELAAGALELPPVARRPRGPRGAGGVPAIRVACVDERGIAPREHQADDDFADPATADAALDLALGIADAVDAQLADERRVSVSG